MSGILIAMCGLDGSGKTTQIGMLTTWFEKQNLPLLNTRQPTDLYRNDPRVRAYLDEGICNDMRAIAMLSAADRLWHMREIEQSLDEGTNVISDRYIYSSYAFFRARGLEIDYLKSLYGSIRQPDLTVFLDIKPEVTIERIKNRDGQLKFEEKDTTIFNLVRQTFQEVMPEEALIMNGERDAKDIHEEIKNHLETIIRKKEERLYEVK